MDDFIPPLTRPEDMPPVHTQADLSLHWRALLGRLGFTETLLWFMFFDADGRCAPLIGQIDDLPDVPDDRMMENLLHTMRLVLEHEVSGGCVAFLLSRPGRAGLTAADRAWASRLSAAARRYDVPCHPVHLANDHELRVFTPDDEIASA